MNVVKVTADRVKVIRSSDIAACPHMIMVPEHYRRDGTCRCDDRTHHEMARHGYAWCPAEKRWL